MRCDLATTPHAKRLAALPEREQYTAMELWRGLMTNHSFVVHRSDVNKDELKVRFDDERYLRYVPIRRPWTMCVQERTSCRRRGCIVEPNPSVSRSVFFSSMRRRSRCLTQSTGVAAFQKLLNESGRSLTARSRLFREALVVRPGGI